VEVEGVVMGMRISDVDIEDDCADAGMEGRHMKESLQQAIQTMPEPW
jgi:hypothetical protein